MVQNPKANSIQRELVQIEASVQNFCRLEAASSLLPPHTSLALGDFGQGGAAASGRSGAGVERRWWQRPMTRLQRLVFCIMRQGRCAEHASQALMCARSEHETGRFRATRRGILHAAVSAHMPRWAMGGPHTSPTVLACLEACLCSARLTACFPMVPGRRWEWKTSRSQRHLMVGERTGT